MPDLEQLGLILALGLLLILYVLGVVLVYAARYWYLVAFSVTTVVAIRLWWKHRHPVYLDEDDEFESVSQE